VGAQCTSQPASTASFGMLELTRRGFGRCGGRGGQSLIRQFGGEVRAQSGSRAARARSFRALATGWSRDGTGNRCLLKAVHIYFDRMGVIRRHLRAWTAVWALSQCAILTALMPRDCCTAHRHGAGESAVRCGETVPGAQCPMRSPDGTPCPMHRVLASDGHAHNSGHAKPSKDTACSLRGTCKGPFAALAALLSNQGIAPEVVTVSPDRRVGLQIPIPVPLVRATSIPPDTPPPRA
jgi:hypothetical protein